MYPFSSFRPLSSDINDTIDEVVCGKNKLVDSCSLKARPDNVFIVWYEVAVGEAVNTVEIAVVGSARQRIGSS